MAVVVMRTIASVGSSGARVSTGASGKMPIRDTDPVPNLLQPDWDAEQDRPPFTWRRARLGRQAGSEKLGASLFEVPPGASTFPFHVHTANEELLVVVEGRPTLRTSDDER